MSSKKQQLAEALKEHFGDQLVSCGAWQGEITIEVDSAKLLDVSRVLHDDSRFRFHQLVDLCGVDYAAYGDVEWQTETATTSGFSRGVDTSNEKEAIWQGQRFGVVYHLLSHHHNCRLRMRTFADANTPVIDSVIGIWASADWYEREAFDLYGILFDGHPDLRRILTDYGFIGHPFRKDFPLSGHVEMRYDTEKQRVIYQPVSIEPRVLVPRVIRHDSRYGSETETPAEEAPAGEG
jgi:NADH-quinone oxidoreductase subunit C